MYKIVVPIDFSESSKNAFIYAQHIAEQLKLGLEVVHIVEPMIDQSDPSTTPPYKDIRRIKKKALASFIENNTLQAGQSAEQIRTVVQSVSIKVMEGLPSQHLIRYSKNKEVIMIVMGTLGTSDYLRQLFGSVATKVAQQAFCPVWLIPKEASYKSIRTIVYASDYSAIDEVIVQKVVEFSNALNADIHMVHVNVDLSVQYTIEKELYEQIIRRNAPNLLYKRATIRSASIRKGIEHYCIEEGADTVALGTIKKGVFERLFHKSITKQMALYTKKPLLVMHFDD